MRLLKCAGLLVGGLLLVGCGAPPMSAPPPVPPPPPPPPAQFQLPDFPWPPPTPSARFELSRRLLARADEQYAVADVLTRALSRAGYSEYSFYRAPGGFALVARLERMREDGTAAPGDLRFLEPGAEEPFSLATYLSRLFFAPAGFYRQIVFVVTDQPFTTSATEQLTPEEAKRLLRGGANRLPEVFRTRPFNPSHAVTALIYEFRKGPDDRDVTTLDPGRLQGRTHLERAGILAALERP